MSVVIWTLARTGGTSLTAAIRELLGRPATLHEPLNPTGDWGATTTRTPDTGLASVTTEISRHLRARPIVKHCVEMVPFRITEGLAEACAVAGYRHIVLIRLDETARMMSWLLMAATGAATPDELDALSRDEVETRLARLTKAHFVLAARQSRTSIARLNRLKALLESSGTGHLVLAYEDIFRPSRKGMENPAFRDAMRFLHIEGPTAPERATAVERWLVDTRQESNRYYPFMTRHFPEPPTFPAKLDFRIGEYAGVL